MTITNIITCSTCGNKIKLKVQVGYIFPVVVKIACNKCGKLIKGEVRREDPSFVFPGETVSQMNEDTQQTVSISTELPIALKVSNVAGFGFGPFMGITTIIDVEKIAEFESTVRAFISLHAEKYSKLVTCYELFENRNWEYFLIEVKKHFRPSLSLDLKSFEECAIVLSEVNKDFFRYLATPVYQAKYTITLHTETIDKVLTKKTELINLKVAMQGFIEIETEFIKGVKLIEKFLRYIKSFFPVIALSYKDDFTAEFKDEIGLTTFEFLDLKEIYIEQFEFLCRVSALYFGLLNLAVRNNFDDFGPIRDCSVLQQYFSKDNGIKKDIIKKDPLLNFYFHETLNSQIRNGIGHLKTIYDPKTQIIRYYPYKEAAKMNSFKEIYLVDFAFQVYQQSLKVRDSIEILTKFLNATK